MISNQKWITFQRNSVCQEVLGNPFLTENPHCPSPYRDLAAMTAASLESADITSVKVFELYPFLKAVLAQFFVGHQAPKQ